MSYSTCVQSYIGVPNPACDTTTNQYANLGSIACSASIEPSFDLSTEMGRQTKRFKTAFISEIDSISKINRTNLPIEFESGERLGSTLNQSFKVITIDTLSAGVTGAVTATCFTPGGTLVVLATKNGDQFACYSTDLPTNVKIIWTASTSTSSRTQTIRCLDYSPSLNVFVGHDIGRGVATSQYVYCSLTDLNNWQFLDLPVSFTARGATYLPTEALFIVFGGNGTVLKSSDGLQWYSVPFPTNADIKDFCVREDVKITDTSSYRYIVSSTSGYYGYTSLSSSPTLITNKSAPVNTSMDALCWNPRTRSFLAIKNLTSEFNVMDETLLQAHPNNLSSGSNKGSRLYLTPALYVPELRVHFLSRLTINAGESSNGTWMWDGGPDTTRNLTNFPNQNLGSGSLSSNSTVFTMGKVTYNVIEMMFAAPIYQGQATSGTTGTINNLGLMIAIWSMQLPPMEYPYATDNGRTPSRSIPNSSDQTMFDKFDRLVNIIQNQNNSTIFDYQTGGVGSEAYPQKNGYFSNTLKLMASGVSPGTTLLNQHAARPSLQVYNMHPRANILDGMNTGPMVNAAQKGLISVSSIQTKNWTNDKFTTAIGSLQANFNMKSIGFPLNTTFILNKDGKIWYNSTGSSSFASQTLQATVGISGTNIFGQDIAFSPTLNRFVYCGGTLYYANSDMTQPNLNVISGSYTACVMPPVGNTGAVQNIFSFVEWIPWFGDSGAFVALKGNHSSNVATANSNDHIMISYDGIYFQKLAVVSEVQVQSLSASTKFFTSFAHDPSTREFGICQRADPNSSYGATLLYINKTGVNSNMRLSQVTTFTPPLTAGSIMKVAFSPKLRVWVAVLGIPGTSAAGITTNNLWYSTPPGYNSSDMFGINSTWRSISTKHIGNGTQYCNWVDVKWHESLQMFIAINSNSNFSAPNVLDSCYWYSTNGSTWQSVGKNPSSGHSQTDITSLLEEGTQGIEIDKLTDTVYLIPQSGGGGSLIGYKFDLTNNTSVMHINYQFGTAVTSSNNPALGAVVTWTFNFPTAFTNTPTHVLFNFVLPSSSAVYSMSTALSAKSTTSFTVTAIGTSGAVATGTPTIMWQAWE